MKKALLFLIFVFCSTFLYAKSITMYEIEKFDSEGNVKVKVQDRAKEPLKETATVSIAAGSSGSATINVPAGYRFYIKSWTVTSGADVTVTSITIDGNDTYQTGSLADTVTEYGDLITADSTITISGSNAGLAAEDLTIEIKGYKVEK